MTTYTQRSRRARAVLAGAVLASIATICAAVPGYAITPVVPVVVSPGADTQVEHQATTLPQMYVAAGIDPLTAGSGVKVGIIDSGVAVYPEKWHAHTNACFSDAGYPPAVQSGDTRFTNNKVIVARVYGPAGVGAPGSVGGDITPEAVGAHGSHVAGIVGCNAGTPANVAGAPVGTIRGIAPRVLIGSYNVFPGEAGFGSGDRELAAAVDDAVADGMQIINMSLGSPAGSPAALTLKAVRRAEKAGVLVVVAAGNEGPKAGTVGSPGIFGTSLTVGSTDGGRVLETTVTVGDSTFTGPVGSIGIPVRPVSAPLAAVRTRDGKLSEACKPGLIPASVAGSVAVVSRGTCTFFEKLENLQAAGAVGAILVSQDRKSVV